MCLKRFLNGTERLATAFTLLFNRILECLPLWRLNHSLSATESLTVIRTLQIDRMLVPTTKMP